VQNAAGTPFFLTGGTALSRYYTHHRYSDGLDFFVIRKKEGVRLDKWVFIEDLGTED
jgi:predicted nucleotidyltransferase component of viral defense system